MRSKLFVPGGRPELFAKALAGEADALSFDLEDSVTPELKGAARTAVAAFLATEAARQSPKLMIVRTNAPSTPYFNDDVEAVVGDGVTLINLPKIESAEEVRAAVDMIARVEAARGWQRRTRLLVNIETPRALARAASIAGAHPRVAGLQLGLADMFEPYGIERHELANVQSVLFTMRMAAAQADVFALDGAYADVANSDGYRAEAALARRLGYLGKSCIHPRQVALANEAFAVSEAEMESARRIVEAAREPGNQGRGAFMVDGKMVDLPFLKRAQALLAAAHKP
ncbi:CoA ester lyase [Dyella sp. LX-66]|uniref:HpcH/HpaI aldolase/citrate lyase family protein n=1 Tax=unclassified Dyella TaxID=2634549 RepID=UPI001BE0CD7C|nr:MULTISPECIES: CoA ester lyase [unclassified Dyella]MBT2117636.1 CoA ester lyase [Dyella sp. LX-1]MBT2141360.1 CoA ester lyase [Dyella sp. LX-66]